MNYNRPSVTKVKGGARIEILHDGKSVSRLWVVDRHMRIGAAVVSVAGIAGVGTDRDHRLRGLALRVLRHSLKWMQQEQYDTSVLFGIENFYHRVGFATIFPEHGFSIDTRSAESARSPLRTRPMQAADLRAVRSLYNRQNHIRTATAVRDASWDGFSMGSGFGVPGAAHVVCARGARDKVLGYVLHDDVADRCRIAEVAGNSQAVYAAILHGAAQRAVELRRERISASVSTDHPFAVFCRRFGYHDETRYPRNAGPMGRVLDTSRFFAALAPELARRWPADAPQQLCVRGDTGTVILERRGRTVRTREGSIGRPLVIADAAVLMQLAMGYRDADDAIDAGAVVGTGVQKDLARALFPLRTAHMWWPDRF